MVKQEEVMFSMQRILIIRISQIILLTRVQRLIGYKRIYHSLLVTLTLVLISEALVRKVKKLITHD